MKVFLSVAALAAAFALAPSAWAQGALPERVTPMFKALDTNGDGKVTLEEFLAGPRGQGTASSPESRQHLETRFRQLDSNGDGVLSPNELIGAGRGAGHPTR